MQVLLNYHLVAFFSLFKFFLILSHKWKKVRIMTTVGTSVASAGGSHHVQACNHEEADAIILIYLQDAFNNGATTCMLDEYS